MRGQSTAAFREQGEAWSVLQQETDPLIAATGGEVFSQS